MNYALLADVVTALHLACVIYVILGQTLVLVGWPLRWRWIKNPWFRLSHLAVILYISQNAARGKLCFLTIWEWDLRDKAGQESSEGSFLGRILHDILFVDMPQKQLDKVYLAFAGVVLLSLVCVRPRFSVGSALETPGSDPEPS